jgi:hypothetical protein
MQFIKAAYFYSGLWKAKRACLAFAAKAALLMPFLEMRSESNKSITSL